jgi:predicted PurR-regulated permease PerM
MPGRPDRGGAAGQVPPAGDPATYRGRLSSAAQARGIPLATILTTLLLAFLILDVNALVILLLWVLRTIILYTVVASFIALLLSPAVRFVGRSGVPRSVAVTVVFLTAIVVFLGVVILFTAPLVSAVTHFAKDLPNLVREAKHGHGPIGHLLTRFHLQQWVDKNASKLAGDVTKSLKPAQALSVGAAAVSTLIALGTIAVLSLFLLLEAPRLRDGFLGLLSPARAERVVRVYNEASRSVSGYMLGNALTSVIAGVIVFITLVIMGVPYPGLLGLWVALVDLLPLVGGLLAGVPVVIVAAFHSLPALIVTAVVFLVYQQIENHLLNPMIMSKTVRLNPLWVLLAVLVGATLGAKIGSSLGAFVGALIGIPVGGAVQVVVREIRKGPGPPAGAESGPEAPGSPDGSGGPARAAAGGSPAPAVGERPAVP